MVIEAMNCIKSNAHKLLLTAISDYCSLKLSGEWERLLDYGRVVQLPIIAVRVDNVEVVRERAEETRAIGEVVWGFLGGEYGDCGEGCEVGSE